VFEMVPVELVRVVIDEGRDEQAIVLEECGGGRAIPILIGIFEATVIQRLVKQRRAERPLTHDLIPEVIRRLGARLRRVEIDERRGDVYIAKLVIARGEEEIAIDCRPSDAVALALHEEVPILVAEAILDQRARDG